jgi:ABC-type multidrug transport system permease subunit
MMQPILAVMYREYKIRITSLVWLFYDIIMPFAYLLIFGLGFNAAFASGITSSGTAVSYNTFFLPSVLAMASFGIAINTSYGFFVDRDNGIFYEFLTYPMTRSQFLVGKITFNCLTSLVQALVAIALGTLFLGVRISPENIPLLLAGVIVGTAGWFFFLAIFALRIRRNDTFNTLINVLYFVLMFLSSLFYPVDTLPAWFRVGSYLNPITWHTDVLRYFSTGIGHAPSVLAEMAAFTLFLLVSFWFAVRTLQKSV